MSIFSKLFPDANDKVIKAMQPTIDTINGLEEEYKKLSADDLKAKTLDFKSRLENGSALDDILPEAFAAVRESASRILGQRHYDVQLVGGIVLHRGQIAEMRTGEGKTLVATLPIYLNALEGKGVHLITVNDYLARVGAGWMAPVYYALGLNTGVIIHDNAYIYDPSYIDESQFDERLQHFRRIPRREAYYCDITYGTNNEFGFDYLRDNMAWSLEECVQREHFFAVVDEVDSILIDEARTPLIISGPADKATKWYVEFANLVGRLQRDVHYEVDEKKKTCGIIEEGVTKVEEMLQIGNLYESANTPMIGYLNNAIRAKELFKRDKDYVVMNGELLIVDEHTGRMLAGRRYSEGLHQALEA